LDTKLIIFITLRKNLFGIEIILFRIKFAINASYLCRVHKNDKIFLLHQHKREVLLIIP